MKSGRSVALLVLLAFIIVSSPAFAADTLPSLPPPIFDPCVGSTLTGDMGIPTWYDVSCVLHYCVSTLVYNVYNASGQTVGRVITNYKRVDFPGGISNVAMDDTFIDLVNERTVFGHSVNRNTSGIIGVEGVITGAVTFTGDLVNVKGTYITTNFGGTNHFCAYLQ